MSPALARLKIVTDMVNRLFLAIVRMASMGGDFMDCVFKATILGVVVIIGFVCAVLCQSAGYF